MNREDGKQSSTNNNHIPAEKRNREIDHSTNHNQHMDNPTTTTTTTLTSFVADDKDKDRRSTIQHAGESSGVGDERSSKVRKISGGDDPVALARKALEMYRKEVEDDGDFEAPDTSPGAPTQGNDASVVPKRSSMAKTIDVPNGMKQSHTTRNGTVGKKIPFRQPMVIAHDDDPSIL